MKKCNSETLLKATTLTKIIANSLNKPLFAGLDIAPSICQLAIQDIEDQTKIINFQIKPDALENYLRNMAKDGQKVTVAMESCACSNKWHNVIEGMGHEAIILSAKEIKNTASPYSNKTDYKDAEKILRALCLHKTTNILTQVHGRSDENMIEIFLFNLREFVIKTIEKLNKLINSFLREITARGHSKSKPKDIIEDLITTLNDIEGSKSVNNYNETIIKIATNYFTTLESCVAQIDDTITEEVKENKALQIIKSIPGVNNVIAFGLLAHLGDVTRFSSLKKVCSYLGVAPKVVGSGGKNAELDTRYKGIKKLKRVLFQGGMSKNRIKQSLCSGKIRKEAQKYANKIVRIAVTLLRKGEFFDKNYKDKRFINKHKYKAQGLVEIAQENRIEIAL